MENGWEIDLLPINESKQSGDCILLRFGDLFNGKDKQAVCVIDGGFSKTAESVKNHLRDYYNCYYNNRYEIDIVVLTHTDQDHISGLVKLLEDDEVHVSNLIVNAPWYTITRSWFKDNRITPNSLKENLQTVFESLAELIRLAKDKHKSNIIYGVDVIGKTIECLNGKFTILGPKRDFYNICVADCEKTKEPSNFVPTICTEKIRSLDTEEIYIPGKIIWPENDSTSPINESSIVFLFECEGTKILFTGDGGRMALSHAYQNAKISGIDLSDVDILKFPHHGSRHNISPKLLDIFTSSHKTCYISCATGDEGHHPSKRVVNLLIEKGFRVLTTSGSTLHRGKNAPDRGWNVAKPLDLYPRMEKLDL